MQTLSIKNFIYISILLFLVCLLTFEVNLKLFVNGWYNFIEIITSTPQLDGSVLKVSITGMIETLQIAYIGTFLGGLISLPAGLLASRNLFPPKVTLITRVFLAAIRTLPALLWAIIFVILVGLGPIAGALATVLYTVGYLSKLFADIIEGAEPESLQALKGIGLSKFQIVQHVLLPQVANGLISQLIFIFEYNVRASTILGFVGAGGIGFYMSAYLKLLQYDKVATLILVVFAVVLVLEFLSLKIRDNFLLK